MWGMCQLHGNVPHVVPSPSAVFSVCVTDRLAGVFPGLCHWPLWLTAHLRVDWAWLGGLDWSLS